MINKINLYLVVCLFFVYNSKAEQAYQPNWDSLANHNEAPEWFRNAKFGIYFHWGPYSVPAFGNEHYPRTMYGHPSGKKPVENKLKKNYIAGLGFQSFREHEFHITKYGSLNDFEYHDLIPLFKAEKFDAYEWATLLRKLVRVLPVPLLSTMMGTLCGTLLVIHGMLIIQDQKEILLGKWKRQ